MERRGLIQCQHCKSFVHWVFIQSVEELPVCLICRHKHNEAAMDCAGIGREGGTGGDDSGPVPEDTPGHPAGAV